MQFRHIAWPALAVATSWAACLDFDQYEADNALNPATTTATGTGGSTTSGGGTTTVATTGSGGSGGTTSTGGTGGTTSTGGTGGTTSTGGSPPGTTVPCDTTPCDVSTNTCCLGQGGPSCQMSSNCAGQRFPVTCNEPADCPGQVCCGVFGGGGYQLLECRNTCNAMGEVILCSSNNDCGGGDTCQNSMFLPMGYQVCR